MRDGQTGAAGVRAIAAYKTVKAAAQLAVALLLAVLLPFGLPRDLQDLALSLHPHLSHAWALGLAALLQRGSTPHGILLVCLALAFDGSLTGFEAWALRTRRWWGAWLVVVATGVFLPFEVYELLRAPRASRALLLAVNLGIVLYLAQRAARERAARHRPERD